MIFQPVFGRYSQPLNNSCLNIAVHRRKICLEKINFSLNNRQYSLAIRIIMNGNRCGEWKAQFLENQ